jgi:hypothetical protein
VFYPAVVGVVVVVVVVVVIVIIVVVVVLRRPSRFFHTSSPTVVAHVNPQTRSLDPLTSSERKAPPWPSR